jgi:ribosomal peptide maturation radical SAM protein 1
MNSDKGTVFYKSMIKMNRLDSELSGGDALIIVPPFASLDKPSLGGHILQSCARKVGCEVKVLYANLILAAEIGEINYEAICYAPIQDFIGERLFASAAYNLPPLGSDGFSDRFDNSRYIYEYPNISTKIELPDLKSLEEKAAKWVSTISEAVIQHDFKVIGCTSTFEQTAASVALLNRIKRACPEIVTIIGGANCLGEMAEGILSLGATIDYVFSGASETSFPSFLKDIYEGRCPSDRIIYGKPCMNLEDIPTPDFAEFYRQIEIWLPNSSIVENGNIWLPYESSRGCWWGQKHQCTFCGLNGETIKFRQKSADRVLGELKELLKDHPTKNVCMSDCNMPYEYFKTLIPGLSNEIPEVNIFYELKSNLSLEDVVALKKAGIAIVQPGIESLSTPCLKLMNKGVSARQNINLLRYARCVSLALGWNILFAFPGDQLEEYQHMLEILPLMRHLHPPLGLSHLSIERFSQYFVHPDKYGIRNIHSIDEYSAILPQDADIAKIAYHFVADYKSESKEHPDLMQELKKEIESWRSSWVSDVVVPALAVTDLGNDLYLLLDTRALPGTQEINFLTHDQASVVLTGGSPGSRDEIDWALKKKLIVKLDSKYVPLATARPELLHKFETESKNSSSIGS